MGVRILHNRDSDIATLYCSTTDWAFGPVFWGSEALDADQRAQKFLDWFETADLSRYERLHLLGRDVRSLTDRGLERAYGDWLAQEAAQIAEAKRLEEEEAAP
jgi:hypothetical protein